MKNVATELQEIAEALGVAVKDAEKFDNGNDTAGTRVRKACQEAKQRLMGVRHSVTEVRTERKANSAG